MNASENSRFRHTAPTICRKHRFSLTLKAAYSGLQGLEFPRAALIVQGL
ncbi:MAG: hypothetical protein NTV43_17770 [Methylococcales bacterium]|nr:hypothetical protein [Methylococcales bacterium]